jgi:hypothetical protein
MTKDEAQRRRWTFYEAVKLDCGIIKVVKSRAEVGGGGEKPRENNSALVMRTP